MTARGSPAEPAVAVMKRSEAIHVRRADDGAANLTPLPGKTFFFPFFLRTPAIRNNFHHEIINVKWAKNATFQYISY